MNGVAITPAAPTAANCTNPMGVVRESSKADGGSGSRDFAAACSEGEGHKSQKDGSSQSRSGTDSDEGHESPKCAATGLKAMKTKKVTAGIGPKVMKAKCIRPQPDEGHESPKGCSDGPKGHESQEGHSGQGCSDGLKGNESQEGHSGHRAEGHESQESIRPQPDEGHESLKARSFGPKDHESQEGHSGQGCSDGPKGHESQEGHSGQQAEGHESPKSIRPQPDKGHESKEGHSGHLEPTSERTFSVLANIALSQICSCFLS
jgi:hypothetical protein